MSQPMAHSVLQHIDKNQFITFSVEKQEYGVDIMSVREIRGWTETTLLPNTPKYIRGVINLRGAVVPIIDLRCRFGMGLTHANKNHVVMIVNIENRIVGILVDAVCDILMISPDEVRPIPSIDNMENASILKGIISLNDRMVALLILEKLLDSSIDIADVPSTVQDLTALLNRQVDSDAGVEHVG